MGRAVEPEPLTLELRLLQFLITLPEEKSFTVGQLARRFGCSEERMWGALDSVLWLDNWDPLLSFVQLDEESGRVYRYQRLPGVEKKGLLHLSRVEARSVLLALDLVGAAADPQLVVGLRNKIETAGARRVGEIPADRYVEEDAEVVAAIERARSQRRVLRIRYPSRGELRDRDIEPVLMARLRGIWYVGAYCRLARAERIFRLDRIAAATPTREEFPERPGLAARSLLADLNPREFADHTAVVRFSAGVARWMSDHPELDLVAEHPDGSADYRLHYAETRWAVSRVLGYGGETRVIEPEGLRRAVADRAAELLGEE